MRSESCDDHEISTDYNRRYDGDQNANKTASAVLGLCSNVVFGEKDTPNNCDEEGRHRSNQREKHIAGTEERIKAGSRRGICDHHAGKRKTNQ